ncbi:hypothetical protein AVEN_158846-1 [Araneus ventricosus]|uniref:Uncharacterized protein n=1 Tax=Araneus ventricosus TaxID=182803 RepID=A0A4Y2MYU5_ARAVE|nr:hypothetical protein AVEN_158846-1 [Araneus ventricosus]
MYTVSGTKKQHVQGCPAFYHHASSLHVHFPSRFFSVKEPPIQTTPNSSDSLQKFGNLSLEFGAGHQVLTTYQSLVSAEKNPDRKMPNFSGRSPRFVDLSETVTESQLSKN